MDTTNYPWHALTSGDHLDQGDILEGCTVFLPPDELVRGETAAGMFEAEERNLIVMSQSCDLVAGREKVSDAVCCPIWDVAQYKSGHLASAGGLEEVRRGVLPSYHMHAASELSGSERPTRIVDFRQFFPLPITLVRREAESVDRRLRLLPPYREHLAQAFARFFMRIGLPLDIPPFR